MLAAAFANLLLTIDNMGNQVIALQAQATATATATANTARISKLLADPVKRPNSLKSWLLG